MQLGHVILPLIALRLLDFRCFLAFLVGSVAPNVDALPVMAGKAGREFHMGATHGLLFLSACSLLWEGVFESGAWLLLGGGLHLLGDSLVEGGVPVFWPLGWRLSLNFVKETGLKSQERYSWWEDVKGYYSQRGALLVEGALLAMLVAVWAG